MRFFAIAALLAGTATAALADSTSGTVVAFDRVARILVLDDKSVWSLETLETLPEALEAGVRIVIDYKSNGDSGWSRINSITIKD